MLNLKKGLAVVLAAATALTFAPVANLGQAVTANAEASTITSADASTLINNTTSVATWETTVGGYKTYWISENSHNDDQKYKLSWDNSDAIAVTSKVDNKTHEPGDADILNGATVTNKSGFSILAKAKGTVTMTLSWGDGAANNKKITWRIIVNNPSEKPGVTADLTAGTEPAVRNTDGVWYVHMDDGTATKATKVSSSNGATGLFGGYWDITKVQSSDDKTVKVNTSYDATDDNGIKHNVFTGASRDLTDNPKHTTDATDPFFGVNFLHTGSATLNVTMKVATATKGGKTTYGTYEDGKTETVTIKFVVLAQDSTFKAGDTSIEKTDYTSVGPDVVETLYLTEKDPSKSLNVTFSDEQFSGEGPKYEGVALNKSTDLKTAKKDTATADTWTGTSYSSKYDNTDLTIDSKGQGTVTATANALNATEQYYDILVTNNDPTAANAKSGIIRVITIRNAKDFTNLEVKTKNKAADLDAKVSASYDTNGSIKDGNDTKALTLSTKDLAEVPFVATTNSSKAVDIQSSDKSVVEYDSASQSLKAKKVGSAVVTVKASSDTKYYGNATLTFNIDVTDQYVINAITVKNATPIVLTKDHKTETIEASTPGKNALKFTLVTPNADGSYSATTDSHVAVEANTGKVTYTGVGAGEAIVEITGTANTDALAPAAAHVTVQYTDKKAASQLKVDKNALNLDAGETKSVAASGTAITVSSSDPEVATATYADGQVSVTGVKKGVAVITVTDAGNASYDSASAQIVVYVDGATVTPEKVTGLKVSNKKGAKVSVTWTSQGKNINYRVYKKVGNGKWVAKNVAGSKTTLSVKKGAKVQVKVKSYVKDENGKTTWGPAATKAKTFKTDKK